MQGQDDRQIIKQVSQLVERYPYFSITHEHGGSLVLKGVLGFECDFKGRIIQDEFDLELHIPSSYPSEMPTVKEIGFRIPRDFHINLHDNSLCLAAPVAVKLIFSEEKTLLGFVDNLVIPFFYNFLHQQKYGTLIFGELSHGPEGILEFYKHYFQEDENATVVNLLKILATDNYRGYSKCPCGSGKNLRNCHGRQLLRCMLVQKTTEFGIEYSNICLLLSDTSKKG